MAVCGMKKERRGQKAIWGKSFDERLSRAHGVSVGDVGILVRNIPPLLPFFPSFSFFAKFSSRAEVSRDRGGINVGLAHVYARTRSREQDLHFMVNNLQRLHEHAPKHDVSARRYVLGARMAIGNWYHGNGHPFR